MEVRCGRTESVPLGARLSCYTVAQSTPNTAAYITNEYETAPRGFSDFLKNVSKMVVYLTNVNAVNKFN